MKRWLESMWLLVLVPALVNVALDVFHGVTRPEIWLVRSLPMVPWLALVAWARASSSRLAQQVRVELRLTMLGGIFLLVSSSSALLQDTLPGTVWGGLLSFMPWVMAVVLPVSAVGLPMTAEHGRGTLEALFATPSGPRIFGIKFALSATLVCLSWLLLQGTPMEDGGWWFAFAGHLVAVATVPTWFLLARSEAATLGLTVLVPYFLVLPVAFFAPSLVPPFAGLYLVLMLALVPVAVRRGIATGIPPWMTASLGGPRGVLFREQRDALWMTVTGLIAGGVMYFETSNEGAVLMIFVFSGVSAIASASLAFAEARAQGTLEVELAAWARSRVLLKRAAGSLMVSVLISVVLPLGGMAMLEPLKPSVALAWTLLMLVVWCVGLAASVHVSSAGTGIMLGMGAGALLCLHAWAFVLTFLTVEKTLSGHGSVELFAVLDLLVLAAIALGVAAHRFLRADRAQPRLLMSAAAGSVAAAAVFGFLAGV